MRVAAGHIVAAALLLPVGVAGQVKPEESLRKIFGDSVAVERKTLVLTAAERKDIAERARSDWRSDTIAWYLCRARDSVAGYGFLDNVKGKMNLITYLVGLTPGGTVADVDVLAYRESYGGEIAYRSFRNQFRGKGSGDGIVAGKDIRNISGATISVHAITDGVRRIVATFARVRERLR